MKTVLSQISFLLNNNIAVLNTEMLPNRIVANDGYELWIDGTPCNSFYVDNSTNTYYAQGIKPIQHPSCISFGHTEIKRKLSKYDNVTLKKTSVAKINQILHNIPGADPDASYITKDFGEASLHIYVRESEQDYNQRVVKFFENEALRKKECEKQQIQLQIAELVNKLESLG